MNTNNLNPEGKRVVIGLSGGVDSAVAALLLKRQGADVHALHMTNWNDDDGYCTAARDLQDARQLCDKLDVPLHHVNFAKEYRDQVFEHFLQEYRAGRTPNPDVLCNREIKFGVFRQYAKRLGADLMATGHYARTRVVDNRVQLLKAADKSKDQSYFLHAVGAEALSEALFPLGELQKSEVREIARDNGLHVSGKRDSTGICFIGERPFREFLSAYLPANPGPIRSADGMTIGQHNGLMYYTIGQRQGLGVGGRRDASDAPWYVAAKDLENNALIVVQGEHDLLYCDHLATGPVSWIGEPPEILARKGAMPCAAKIRYRQSDQTCLVRRAGNAGIEVLFELRQRAIAPGQYAVLYDGDRCLGGAIIEQLLSGTDALRAVG
ncbi:MAG: tRNA 2-thiouridine(34) synthase MnmA [Gammaproteobacteria bacterium]|nr:tRNA 2-thiouridine(34) synthase MnmA [Gammaproteobacteria bacterium]MDH4313729.1 tRNA 2-thiouridine(34) synthase MnmA [Gammaproteobacteria bacterium]MDH5212973.1 tRNA 2-thiouridine(34) synthase MnmA [Gammaproteobacteria bacterium]MDH5500857.1 tRNA 2-thiouridine(34) synthase MnmA [Gammaproteobacteria bacterium]